MIRRDFLKALGLSASVLAIDGFLIEVDGQQIAVVEDKLIGVREDGRVVMSNSGTRILPMHKETFLENGKIEKAFFMVEDNSERFWVQFYGPASVRAAHE